ncbi:MAG: hypothetical protein AAGA56_14785 [Myxococcota bacterium]
MRILFGSVLLAVFLIACGDDDDTEGETATTTTQDTATDTGGGDAGGVEGLYQVCGEGEAECPGDLICVLSPETSDGDPARGYCAPACTAATGAACAEGYNGPGMPVCFLDECVISCTTVDSTDECPTGLTCLSTGGPTSACFVAP